ncbi:CBS domain-containing protein [Sinimarinibacterium sp. NLF-5-8]|nr:CBS domain-containing protein [Sinimarinibacterium sp. NLF-5-8]
MTVRNFMASSLLTFRPDMDVMEAIHILTQREFSGAPVLDDLGNVIGVLSSKDCMKVALNASYHGNRGGSVSDFMSREVTTVEADMSILEIAKMFADRPQRRYPVMEDNRLVGIITRSNVLRAIDQLNQNSNA